MEIWKEIENFRDYKISNLGRVMNKDNRILKNLDNGKGYLFIKLKGAKFYIHRLVAKHFVVNINNKIQVNHIDGNKSNNNFENLEWVNNAENQQHAFKNNLKKKFKLRRKLSENEISEIYYLYSNKIATREELSKRFNISKQIISNIKTRNGKLYKKY